LYKDTGYTEVNVPLVFKKNNFDNNSFTIAFRDELQKMGEIKLIT